MMAERTACEEAGFGRGADRGGEGVTHAVSRLPRVSRLAGSRRARIVTVVAIGLAALSFDMFLAVRHGFFDLSVYYGAINYWMHDGGSLYDYLLPQNTYGFTYPPFAALTMLPMAITPWTVAIVISCVACIATSVVVIYWL